MNAIERIEDALVDGDQGRKAREALAAVDVLYQAAARAVERHQSPTRELDALEALAAAVRRVDGEA